jgi:MYXO-CTERM domain-containing protein
LARKINTGATDNAAFSQIDKTSIFFTQNCGACHPGGGPGEFDRDGNPYVTYNGTTGAWEFSAARGIAASYYVDPLVGLASGVSGDYGFVNPGAPAPAAARWDLTGVSEADCLMCHLPGYNWTFRTATLGAGPGLMSASGIPAFASAAAAGAGFASVTFSPPPPGKMPQATAVTIAYPAGIDNVWQQIVKAVPDANCRGCHTTPDLRKAGRSWETDTDIHKSGGLTCLFCHPAGSAAQDSRINGNGMHEIAKGNISVGSVRDDIDGTMLGCRECHEAGIAPNPASAHAALPAVHFSKFSCNVCHIPYLQDSVLSTATEVPDLVLDYATDGNGVVHPTTRFLSNNPVDPTAPNPDNTVPATRWYPAFLSHAGTIKTVKPLVTIWWGLWNGQGGTDAIVKPVILRHLRKAIGFAQTTSATPPAGKSLLYTAANQAGTTYYYYINTSLYDQLTDANGDGIVEVNTPAEIVAFIDAISVQTDHFGEPIVPDGWQLVMVKAGKVYYRTVASTVDYFENVAAESPPFAVNHNVRPSTEALGADGCTDCHAPNSPFFYRKELVDPYDETDQAVYIDAYVAMGYTADEAAALSAGVPSTTPPSLTFSSGGGGCAVAGAGGDPGAAAFGVLALAAFGLWRARRTWK